MLAQPVASIAKYRRENRIFIQVALQFHFRPRSDSSTTRKPISVASVLTCLQRPVHTQQIRGNKDRFASVKRLQSPGCSLYDFHHATIRTFEQRHALGA